MGLGWPTPTVRRSQGVIRWICPKQRTAKCIDQLKLLLGEFGEPSATPLKLAIALNPRRNHHFFARRHVYLPGPPALGSAQVFRLVPLAAGAPAPRVPTHPRADTQTATQQRSSLTEEERQLGRVLLLQGGKPLTESTGGFCHATTMIF
jgi:hypothetical protein